MVRTEVVQMGGDHGPLFEVVPPHTAESLRADAERARGHKPLLCRLGHRRRVVGRPYVPTHDPIAATLALISSTDVHALTRCSRCGVVAVRRG